MASPDLAEVAARFRAIAQGLGFDGSLGPEAQAHAIAPGHFRVSMVDIESPGFEVALFDRAIYLDLFDASDRVPKNTRSPHRDVVYRLSARIGYIAHPVANSELAKFVHEPGGDEDARRSAAIHWQARAHNDAQRLARAFEWNELTGNSTNPVIELVMLAAVNVPSRADGGRAVCTVEFTVTTESHP